MSEVASDSRKKRKKRKKRRMSPVPAIVTFIIMALLGAGSFFYISFSRLTSFSGTYERRIDLTDKVVTEASIWLSDLNNTTVSSEWIREQTPEITVMVKLTLTPEKTGSGSYDISVSEDSYDAAEILTYSLLSSCLKSVISDRLSAMDYETLSDEELDGLITSTLGMSLDSYLSEKGISVLPEYDSLSGEYSDSGSYTLDSKTISFCGENAERIEHYAYDPDRLILMDSGLIYVKEAE